MTYLEKSRGACHLMLPLPFILLPLLCHSFRLRSVDFLCQCVQGAAHVLVVRDVCVAGWADVGMGVSVYMCVCCACVCACVSFQMVSSVD